MIGRSENCQSGVPFFSSERCSSCLVLPKIPGIECWEQSHCRNHQGRWFWHGLAIDGYMDIWILYIYIYRQIYIYIYICKSFIFKIYCFVIIVSSWKWMNKNKMYLRKENLMIEVLETSWILMVRPRWSMIQGLFEGTSGLIAIQPFLGDFQSTS